MHSAAQTTLPQLEKRNKIQQIWKNDSQLNELLKQREQMIRKSDAFKLCTKEIKKRVQFLNNEKALKEANSINEFATKRQVEELFRSFKSDNSPFKKAKSTNKCDPVILKEYFKAHFTKPLNENTPTHFFIAQRGEQG